MAGDRRSGWQLEFCTAHGPLYEKKELMRHRYLVAPDFTIEGETRTLSRKICRRTPQVRI